MKDMRQLGIQRLLDRRAVEDAQFDLIEETFQEMLRLLRGEALQQHLVLPKEVQLSIGRLKLNPDEDADQMWLEVDKDADWTQAQLRALAICRTEEDVARDG